MKGENEQMSFKAAAGVIMMALSRHMGPEHAIGADALYAEVFGEAAKGKINGTKALRRLVTALRKKGIAIGSSCRTDGGGYYLVRAGSELEDFRRRMYRRPALRKLSLDAKLGKIALPELLGQITLNLSQRATEAQRGQNG